MPDRVVNNGSVLRFGSGELLLDVFGSFALHVKSPRFIRVGDVFDTAVEIVPKDLPQSSESPIPRLDVIASSPLLEVVGNKSSVLPRDNIFEAHFSLKAMGVGKASFEVVVEGKLPSNSGMSAKFIYPCYFTYLHSIVFL